MKRQIIGFTLWILVLETLLLRVNERTLEWTVLIGPANHRVFVGTNIKTNVTNPLDHFAGPIGANYTEQMQWRDAATGKLLAAFNSLAHIPMKFTIRTTRINLYRYLLTVSNDK